MLKIFAVKYEKRTESFNDSVMSNFLADKEIRYCGRGASSLNARTNISGQGSSNIVHWS